jgi:Ca-activated chloride channel family protein
MRPTAGRAGGRRHVAAGAALFALTLVAAACGYTKPTPGVHLANPGNCVPVDIAASPVTASLLNGAAAHFNGSHAAELTGGGCAFVRIETVDAPVALRELAGNWPDTVRLGPAPAAWVPGSTMWGQLLDARTGAKSEKPIAPDGVPFAVTPLVVAMPAPMAQALGYPHRAVSWSELAQLARDPRGWGAYGHSEWGPFRLGKANPNWSTAGLDQTIAADVSGPASRTAATSLEHSVIYYADTTQTYFDNWRRLAATSTKTALTYLSAAITDERSVVAYNRGHLQSDVALSTRGPAKVALPLVAVYPTDPTIESDNPVIVLDEPWSSAAKRAGARAFTKYLLEPATQATVVAAGYRPAHGTVRGAVPGAADGVDPTARPAAVAPGSPLVIEQALDRWQTDRRPANLLVLFDVSESMRDAAGDGTATKMALAKTVLPTALDELAPRDDVGLRVFTTKLKNPASPNWLDVVPSGPLATRRPALTKAIAALAPEQGSPLYAATRDAYDAVARTIKASRINGVVVVTDGYNEDDHDTDLGALLTHLARNPTVRVFTVAYGSDSDFTTLRRIAQATNAGIYNARNAVDLVEALPRALGNF